MDKDLDQVADGQVQVAVGIPVRPGQAGGVADFFGLPGRSATEYSAVVAIDHVGLAIVADGQVQVAVAVIVGPGDAGGGIAAGRTPQQRKGVVPVVAIDTVGRALVAHGKEDQVVRMGPHELVHIPGVGRVASV